jgi:putative ABC transport system permease protein
MGLVESFKIAIGAIWVNRMRSLLTMLGIIIGISSVIAVVSLGKGSETAFNKEFETFGIDRGYLTYRFDQEPSKNELMNKSDVEFLRTRFRGELKGMSYLFQASGSVTDLTAKNRKTRLSISGVEGGYDSLDNMKLIKGRFFTKSEGASFQQVAVIDEELARSVFGKADAIGRIISVNTGLANVGFRVIGIYEAPKSDLQNAFGGGPSKTIYVPYTTVEKVTNSDGTVNIVDFKVKDKDRIGAISDEMTDILKKRHKTDNDVYRVFTAQRQMETVNGFLGILTSVIGAIAAISLVVGGIGVMNIMLVSVTERTREIGIRKALGATRNDILSQFLVESIIISGIGGVIGTILGIGSSYLMSLAVKITPTIDPSVIVIAWVFSAGVGVFFGIYPANKAAKLDPIESLRYE